MPIWFDGYQQNWMLLLSFWFNFYAILSKEHNKYTINNTKVVLIINIRKIFVSFLCNTTVRVFPKLQWVII